MARKRGQNEGSIYQRKDGKWVGQVSLQGRRLYKYGKTKKEVGELGERDEKPNLQWPIICWSSS